MYKTRGLKTEDKNKHARWPLFRHVDSQSIVQKYDDYLLLIINDQ